MSNPYPPDTLVTEDGYEVDDDGTMPENIEALADAIVGHRIIKAEQTQVKATEFGSDSDYRWGGWEGLVLTLDDGRRVLLADTSNCCAYTSLQSFLLHPDKIDHIITGVATENGYTKWHIFADFGDVMELEVGWSSGNPFYYGYGFDIFVSNVIDAEVEPTGLDRVRAAITASRGGPAPAIPQGFA